MRTVDAVVVGAGHNGLVAAAYLARAGWEVEVLERNEDPGGAVRSAELTLPGFVHDPFSSWHPLFQLSAAYRELGDELRARGLEYRNTDVPGATAMSDGRTVLAHRDPEATAAALPAPDGERYLAELGRFGANAQVVGELLATELVSLRSAALVGRLGRSLGLRGGASFARDVVGNARGWLSARFESDELRALLAPWVLHIGLTPESAGSSFQLLALAASMHEVGMPVVAGGAQRFVEAFVRLIEDHGGRVTTRAGVERVLVEHGRAVGVIAGGEEVRGRRAVIANVTPTQLYGRLLPGEAVPALLREQVGRYRFGRGDMQIHVALREPLRWHDTRLRDAAIVHVTPGLDGVTLACAQATTGLLPAAPTIVCGQPTRLDASRAPAGQAILWIQLQETPYRVRGDAAGELETGDGSWTPSLREGYADRVLGLIARHVENLPDAVLARTVLTPPDLEASNPNLERGDPYGGAMDLDQNYLWRPLPSFGSHETPVPGLWMCGASTYPGPGLNAASGRIVARRLLRATLPQRVRGALGVARAAG